MQKKKEIAQLTNIRWSLRGDQKPSSVHWRVIGDVLVYSSKNSLDTLQRRPEWSFGFGCHAWISMCECEFSVDARTVSAIWCDVSVSLAIGQPSGMHSMLFVQTWAMKAMTVACVPVTKLANGFSGRLWDGLTVLLFHIEEAQGFDSIFFRSQASWRSFVVFFSISTQLPNSTQNR
jgi:hypothetical protein